MPIPYAVNAIHTEIDVLNAPKYQTYQCCSLKKKTCVLIAFLSTRMHVSDESMYKRLLALNVPEYIKHKFRGFLSQPQAML